MIVRKGVAAQAQNLVVVERALQRMVLEPAQMDNFSVLRQVESIGARLFGDDECRNAMTFVPSDRLYVNSP